MSPPTSISSQRPFNARDKAKTSCGDFRCEPHDDLAVTADQRFLEFPPHLAPRVKWEVMPRQGFTQRPAVHRLGQQSLQRNLKGADVIAPHLNIGVERKGDLLAWLAETGHLPVNTEFLVIEAFGEKDLHLKTDRLIAKDDCEIAAFTIGDVVKLDDDGKLFCWRQYTDPSVSAAIYGQEEGGH
ncbi:hypothetical protein D3C73_1026140 [compost metagenome]